MKLGVFTVASRGDTAGDIYNEALASYKGLADEVLVNDKAWPKEFSWEHIGQTFQESYTRINSDWVIRADLDYIFHERDYRAIRMACENNPDAPALSFWKFQFVLPDRYNLKSRLVIAVNKGKFGDRIRFDSGGDLCQPSLDGEYIKPADVPEAGIPFYNYEKLCKTPAQIADDQGRMERAYFRHFGHTQMGSDGTDQDAYRVWIEAQKGKFNKPQKFIKLTDHPKVIQETIKNLTPDQFGYNGHAMLEENKYV